MNDLEVGLTLAEGPYPAGKIVLRPYGWSVSCGICHAHSFDLTEARSYAFVANHLLDEGWNGNDSDGWICPRCAAPGSGKE